MVAGVHPAFDLAHRFDARRVARELELPMLDAPTGILVGNTRALWAQFAAVLAADPALRDEHDPIDRFTERAFAGQRALFSHRTYDGAFLPFQRIAVAAGLGTLSRSQLVIHPIYGPWFALRAIVLVDEPAPIPAPPPVSPCVCGPACTAAFVYACDASGEDWWRAWVAVRDACTAGREHRYDDLQIRYHYRKHSSDLPR